MTDQPTIRGIIGWFATNHVAANLLMLLIIGGGIYSVVFIKKESFPKFEFDAIQVNVPYPGAGPDEVEEGIVIKIEEALDSVEGIRDLSSTASEGMATVSVEIKPAYKISDVMADVKLAVDGIFTLPDQAERPIISKFSFTPPAISVQLYGDLPESSMKSLAEQIRDEIVALPDVSIASVQGTRAFEIAIEISEQTLREYGLTLDQVAQIIRRSSINLPGGTIHSQTGTIRLRADGQAYTGDEFGDIILLSRADGSQIKLGDIATINDGFEEVQNHSYFNGQPSFGIEVSSTEHENELIIGERVRDYVDARNKTLPDSVQLSYWSDFTVVLEDRMNLMLSNMTMGGVLVFIILGLFLHLKVAAWVILGIPVAFLGAFLLMPALDLSINIMSLFAFILVLGIVVDDAIVIAESAYSETEANGYSTHNIVVGVQRVAVPATFGVLTTIMAFIPLLLVSGPAKAVIGSIAWVVIFCLIFSLIESKLILPSHLASMKPLKSRKRGYIRKIDALLKHFIAQTYKPFLRRAIEFRYATTALFISLIILTVGLVAGGLVRVIFFPDISQDMITATIKIQEGMPDETIQTIVLQMNDALDQINEESRSSGAANVNPVKNMFTYISDNRSGFFRIELEAAENRTLSHQDVEKRWRELIGDVLGIEELTIQSRQSIGGGPPIELYLQGKNISHLEAAAKELKAHLQDYIGLYEVKSSANTGPEEIKLRLKPNAENLGVTLIDIARQVRESFYGVEVQRVQRSTEEIKVMVRYPRTERQSIANLEDMWIRLSDGNSIPFTAVAEYTIEQGYTNIKREDGKRTISVSANADLAMVEPQQIIRQISRDIIPDILANHPDIRINLAGSALEERVSFLQIIYAFGAAVFGIYALMAIPLKSYIQPFIIMSAIPFGIIGAVFGHWLLGMPLNVISFIGIIALTGVVVNDSLIMVDFVNQRISDGASAADASIDAGAARFRSILLTSLTTFFGLIPILSETSIQAQVVIPMAVSLAFGILFATVITLVLVPCLYNIMEDWRPKPAALLESN